MFIQELDDFMLIDIPTGNCVTLLPVDRTTESLARAGHAAVMVQGNGVKDNGK